MNADKDLNPYAAPRAEIGPPPGVGAKPAPSPLLIEVLIVLAIIAVLIALLLPAVQASRHAAIRPPAPEEDWTVTPGIVGLSAVVAVAVVLAARPFVRRLKDGIWPRIHSGVVQAKRWIGVPSGSRSRASR